MMTTAICFLFHVFRGPILSPDNFDLFSDSAAALDILHSV
jgi:hypothetical protein